jgi:hypothetical protein
MATIDAPPDFANMTKDDSITKFGPGEYQLGTEVLRLGKNAIVKGSGRDKTRLVNTGYRHSAEGCNFEANDCTLEDICLESRVGVGNQSQVFGWQNNYGSGPQANTNTVARIYRSHLLGRTFACYAWSSRGDTTKPPNTIYAYETRIEAGQYGVSGGGGSGPDAQLIYLFNCDVVIDFERLRGAGGDQNLHSVGLWAQGGKIVMYGGTITIKGHKDSPKARGAWLARPWAKPDEAWPYQWPSMELYNVTCRVTPNGSPDWCDAEGLIGSPILIVGGSGSGPGGEWITKGQVRVVK